MRNKRQPRKSIPCSIAVDVGRRLERQPQLVVAGTLRLLPSASASSALLVGPQGHVIHVADVAADPQLSP